MSYDTDYVKEINNLKNSGFVELCTLWKNVDNENSFAFSMYPIDNKKPELSVVIAALTAILKSFEEQFNSASINIGSQSFTFPVNQIPN